MAELKSEPEFSDLQPQLVLLHTAISRDPLKLSGIKESIIHQELSLSSYGHLKRGGES